MEIYKRNCPKCGEEIQYKSKSRFNNANKNNIPCLKCANKNRKYTKYIRQCPICNKDIQYKKQSTLDIASEYNELCSECSKIKENLKITKLMRVCPECGQEIYYSNYKRLKRAINNKSICKNCSRKNITNGNLGNNRNCPECGRLIGYKTKEAMNIAEKEKILCSHCAAKKSIQINKHFKKKCPQCGNEILYTTQKALDISIKENKVCLKCSINKPETIEKMRKSHIGNKNIYNIWLDKYGEEKAYKKYIELKNKISISMKGKTYEEIYGEKKAKEMKLKISIRTKGKNNPMFGKPSPQGSGNGWSGHYKNIYFRSLLELHYLVYLLDNNINFESGEKRKHAIQYTMDELNRNYFPDFYLIDSKETIEIKPKNLIGTYQNKLKFEAAKNKLGNKHIILTEDDIVKIDLEKLYYMYKEGELVFDKRYIQKFEEYYNKNNSKNN